MRKFLAKQYRRGWRQAEKMIERVVMPHRRVQELEDVKQLYVHCKVWENGHARRLATTTPVDEDSRKGNSIGNPAAAGAAVESTWHDHDQVLLIQSLREEAQALDLDAMQDVVRRCVHKQVLSICRALHDVDSLQESHLGLPNLNMSLSSGPGAKNAVHEYLSRIQGFLSTKVGFSISPGPSTLPGAGTGVHVQGHVPAGAVVAFYPGLAYNREDIDVLAERVKSRGHQSGSRPVPIRRYDGVCIDGRGPVSPRPNQYALGHLVKHPGKGMLPSVMPCSYDFPLVAPPAPESANGRRKRTRARVGGQTPASTNSDKGETIDRWPAELEAYVPNKFYQPLDATEAAHEDCLAKSVLLVATRDIQDGEELFMDYRLSLNQPHPSWYHPVDEEATRRLWVGGRG